MSSKLILISHPLCPYVQRAAIVLGEKKIPYDRIDIDLADKPNWFLNISPLGKMPVLVVDGQAIFESSVICEYLEETTPTLMHPQDPLMRARHRAWMEFASATLNVIGAMYSAPDVRTFKIKINDLRTKFGQIEAVLSATLRGGPYFAGDSFSLVDAAFAPVFRYFDVFEAIEDFEVFIRTPRVNAWRTVLQQRQSVKNAVCTNYPELLREFLTQRKSELSRRMVQFTNTTI